MNCIAVSLFSKNFHTERADNSPRFGISLFKTSAGRAGEMGRFSTCCSSGGLGSVPSSYPVAQLVPVCDSSSRRSDSLFWPLQALHTWGTNTPTGKTLLHIK